MQVPFDPDDDPPDYTAYDPDSDAWSANLLFFRPSRLSDEQMRIHFHEWDGRWSVQTKSALEQSNAKGLDLNQNWALCSPHWFCPSCSRTKEKIFRLSKREILLAKLEKHHDHIRDEIARRGGELFGSDWLELLPRTSIAILDYVREITSRFDYCLLCSECNTADGKVKSKFRNEIDRRFSFTAEEVGSFVQPTFNQDHKVDYEKAHSLWLAEKDNFFLRLELIDELLERISKGQLARDNHGKWGAFRVDTAFDPSALLVEAFNSETKDTERAGLLWRFRDEFLSRSTQRDSANLPSVNNQRVVAEPSEAEFNVYVDPVSPRRWQEAALDWVCPVCARGKRQLLRKSNSGKWTASIRAHTEYLLEQDRRTIANRLRLLPEFRNDIFVKECLSVLLCSDCAGIGIALSQRDQSIRYPYLSIEDRRACIVLAQAHGAHKIDFEIAAQRASANYSYDSASQAYFAYRTKVDNFAVRFERGRRNGKKEKLIIEELAEDIRIFHRIENHNECLDLVNWLLTQHSVKHDPG